MNKLHLVLNCHFTIFLSSKQILKLVSETDNTEHFPNKFTEFPKYDFFHARMQKKKKCSYVIYK